MVELNLIEILNDPKKEKEIIGLARKIKDRISSKRDSEELKKRVMEGREKIKKLPKKPSPLELEYVHETYILRDQNRYHQINVS